MVIPVIIEERLEDILVRAKIAFQYVDEVQLDINDGTLFSGHSNSDLELILDGITKLIPTPTKLVEVHLMVKEPDAYIKKKHDRVDRLCFQIEIGAEKTLELVKKFSGMGYKVGLSVGPDTALADLEACLSPQVAYIQFVTVDPGHKGYPLREDSVERLHELPSALTGKLIQVDGAINMHTVHFFASTPVQNFVSGSYLFGSKPNEKVFAQNLKKLDNEVRMLPNTKNSASSISSLNMDIVNPKLHYKKVAFLGGAAWPADDPNFLDAYETAKLLAAHGYLIVNGGGPGVMRAASKGAKDGGGESLVITYHPNKPKLHYEGVDPFNVFDMEVVTLDYFDRTKVMLQTTDVHIVFRGSIGTLSELGMTWISSWIHEPDNKPIILFGKFWQEIIDILKKNLYIIKNEEKLFKIVETPEEVLEYLQMLEDQCYTPSNAPYSP